MILNVMIIIYVFKVLSVFKEGDLLTLTGFRKETTSAWHIKTKRCCILVSPSHNINKSVLGCMCCCQFTVPNIALPFQLHHDCSVDQFQRL